MGNFKNTKRFLLYFSYILCLIIIIYLGNYYEIILKKKSSLILSSQFYQIFKALINIFIGVMLGFPNFIKKLKFEGKFRINWIKLLAIGFPVFYITISPIIYFTPIGFLPLLSVISTMEKLITTSGIIFGYILIDIFYKN